MKKRVLGDPHYAACPVEAYGSFLCKCDEIFAFHNEGRVTELEAWLAAVRQAAHGGDVSKNVIIMTGRALAGEPAGETAFELLRAYRARVPQTSAGSVSTPPPVQRLAASVRSYLDTYYGKPPVEASCDDASVIAFEALLRVLAEVAPETGSTEPKA